MVAGSRHLKTVERWKPASVNLALAALDSFYTQLGLGRPVVRREELSKSAPRAITEEEQRRLLRMCERSPARDRTIVVMLLYTGLRLAELVALDVDDVRMSARKGVVIVRSGKGDAYREVPLNALVRQVLEEWIGERARRAPDGERAFFLGRSGRRLSKRSVDDVVRGLGEDAGVKLSAHILRHTFLTRMVRQGSDLVLVAELAGHRRLDATHTLDGILDNQTVLPIQEHTTDTHGYTEMIFGAYDLVGLSFWPWIRDLDRQQLYSHGTPPSIESAELLRHKLRPELITPYWDDLLRLAASLRHGWAPASLLLARLQAGSRRNPLARALQEYGRLVKTNFVLAWLGDEELRQRVGRQLNKGEQLHALRRDIFYANEGHVRHRTPDQQAEQALCLAIVVNAIIAWNTVYIQRVLDELRAGGELITTSEIEHISPLARQHLHLYGHYPFNLATCPHGHRPLRTPAAPPRRPRPQRR